LFLIYFHKLVYTNESLIDRVHGSTNLPTCH